MALFHRVFPPHGTRCGEDTAFASRFVAHVEFAKRQAWMDSMSDFMLHFHRAHRLVCNEWGIKLFKINGFKDPEPQPGEQCYILRRRVQESLPAAQRPVSSQFPACQLFEMSALNEAKRLIDSMTIGSSKEMLCMWRSSLFNSHQRNQVMNCSLLFFVSFVSQ